MFLHFLSLVQFVAIHTLLGGANQAINFREVIISLETYLSKCKREGDREGHFIRRSSNVKSYLVSKAVDFKVNCPPKLPVMFKEK